MAQVKKATLEQYRREVNWDRHKNMPFSQGYAINTVISQYKIPAKRWGWIPGKDVIGVETNKQYLFWRDRGTHLEFKGLLNKEG